MKITERALNISDVLYNKGLFFAQEGRISSAISALEQSIIFDKYNIPARNVLGLCFYKIGRIGDALNQFHLSSEWQKTDNPAKRYIQLIFTDTKLLDRTDHSLEVYNSALEFFRGKSYDMAIMRLRKSIELSPNFLEARCLLALGYILTDHYEKALGHLKYILRQDPSHPKALAYYADLEVLNAQLKDKEPRREPKPALMDVKGYAKRENKKIISGDFYFSEIMSIVITGFILVLVFFALVIPGREEDLRDEIERLNDQITITRDRGEMDLEQLREEYADTIEDLEARIEELTEERDALLEMTEGVE